MGFFNWPFSNLHELNLDWIIEKLQNLLHMNVHTYVSTNHTGSYDEEANTLHIPVMPGPQGPEGPQGPQGPRGPQGPEGQPAEDPFSETLNDIMPVFDLNLAKTSGFFKYEYDANGHCPTTDDGCIIVINYSDEHTVQYAYPAYARTHDPYRSWFRDFYTGEGWTEWRHGDVGYQYAGIYSYGNLNNLTDPGIFVYSNGATGAPAGGGGYVINMLHVGDDRYGYQLAFRLTSNGSMHVFIRMKYPVSGTPTWTEWYTMSMTA